MVCRHSIFSWCNNIRGSARIELVVEGKCGPTIAPIRTSVNHLFVNGMEEQGNSTFLESKK